LVVLDHDVYRIIAAGVIIQGLESQVGGIYQMAAGKYCISEIKNNHALCFICLTVT